MTSERREIVAFGDSALLIRFAERIDPQINAAVHSLAGRVRAEQEIGHRPWRAPVPSYASLLVPYDPLRWTFDEAKAALVDLVDRTSAGASPPADEASEAPLEIPVRYGGADGPDLPEVAARTGLTAAEVIELHASVTYRAYVLGFAPGFAYLGRLPERLRLPRRDTPRPRVPPGSVAIAGEQTAVYPLSTPGGWHLLGRTDVRVWDPDREPPALLMPARSVSFVPVTP